MNLTAEQIQSNWNKMLAYINTYISDPRREKLIEFYNIFFNTFSFLCQPLKGYNSMRMPVGTGDAQYSGDPGYGGRFNTSGWVGLEGKHGRIAYKIGTGGWTYITAIGNSVVTI